MNSGQFRAGMLPFPAAASHPKLLLQLGRQYQFCIGVHDLSAHVDRQQPRPIG